MPPTLRRRKYLSTEGTTHLADTLLEGESEAENDDHKKQIIVHPGVFQVEKFLASVFEQWHKFLSVIATYFRLMVTGEVEVKLNPLQCQRLERIRSVSVPFDSSIPEHQQALRELWARAFPGVPCTSLKTSKWKEMGWQGDDPGTDFRGAGLLGLQNLLYLADTYPEAFNELLHKTKGERSTWEYPFAIAGVNVTFMLLDILDMHDHSHLPKSVAAHGFATLLNESETAFEELYVMSFQLLDQVWLDSKASYMEFSQVMKRTREQVSSTLASRPKSLQSLRLMLL